MEARIRVMAGFEFFHWVMAIQCWWGLLTGLLVSSLILQDRHHAEYPQALCSAMAGPIAGCPGAAPELAARSFDTGGPVSYGRRAAQAIRR